MFLVESKQKDMSIYPYERLKEQWYSLFIQEAL